MTEAQFLEELAGLKDDYWWYLNYETGCIRGEAHDTVRTTRVCCPVTAVVEAKGGGWHRPDDALLVGQETLRLPHEVAAAIIDAADNAIEDLATEEDLEIQGGLRVAMLTALGLTALGLKA